LLIDAYKQVIELAPSNVDASLAVAGLLTSIGKPKLYCFSIVIEFQSIFHYLCHFIAIDTRVTVTKITTVIIQHRDIILSTRTDTTYTGVLDTIQSTAMGTITAGAAAAAGELGVTVVNRRKLYDILITLSLLYKMHFQHWFC